MNVEGHIKSQKAIPIGTKTLIHLQLVSNKVTDALGLALKPHDVSLQQFNVLRILRGQHGEPANLSTINERMVSKMSNTTRLVDKLLRKGYVRREVCQTNRRKVEIFITPQGKEALLLMDKAIENAENILLAQCSIPDMQQINRLLDKF
ncbi:MAG: MarR family transcriptional regulator [Bacteroidota bacterium]